MGLNCRKRFKIGVRKIFVMGRIMKHCPRGAGEVRVSVLWREQRC